MSDDVRQRLADALQGRYRLERELDRGGMAIVYLAEDTRHSRRVAVKVLQPIVAQTLGAERFLREVDVVARLQHPNILTLIDSGQADGLPFYVMPFVAGESLRRRLEHGPLAVSEAVAIALEMADALSYAHSEGVIHRDVKPGNVLLSEGHAIVADFGIAGAVEYAATARLTRTGTSMGSPAYMSPEQASGDPDIDHRSDVYSLGAVLFEMLSGTAPFEGGNLQALMSKKLMGEVPSLRLARPEVPRALETVVAKAMALRPVDRFQSVDELAGALRSAVGMTPVSPDQRRRRRVLTAAAASVGVGTLVLLGWSLQRSRAEGRLAVWAAEQRAEIERMSDTGQWLDAFDLAHELEAAVPGDSTLARLRPRFSFVAPIRSEPSGAAVFRHRVGDDPEAWELLGTTPLDSVWFAENQSYRVRLKLDGHVPVELGQIVFRTEEWMAYPPVDPVQLDRVGGMPGGMVRVPGFPRVINGETIQLGEYLIDRFEVTNAEYKGFVDAGGYRDASYWTEEFEVGGGAPLNFEDAMSRFKDQTGRPGPATWSLGTFPEGQGDYPVGGLSWYEAAAYAQFVGKELPSTIHWRRATRYWREVAGDLVPRSNLGGDGPRPVGENEAAGEFGLYDQVGNVREWCWNRVGTGRAARGGAWDDPPFMTMHILPKDPWDRHPTHGVRLVKTYESEEVMQAVRAPVERTVRRDYRTESPVSDTEFAVLRRFYSYDDLPLNPSIEAVDTFPGWVRETVRFDLPYGDRGGAYLYLPHDAARPLQTILYWGGSGVLATNHIDDAWMPAFDFLMKAGRAVAQPMWDGAFQRDDSVYSTRHSTILGPTGEGLRGQSTRYRDYQVHWFLDLARTVDYMETRSDLDPNSVGYLGFSWGGQAAPIVLALEPRIQAAVLNVGGLWGVIRPLPEADPLNFASRARTPVLMLNGEFDNVFPLETEQVPLYRLWGTPEEHKRHIVVPSGHVIPKDLFFRETLDWFDRYLGVP